MASISKRSESNYQVRYRVGNKHPSRSFTNSKDAQYWKGYLELHGAQAALDYLDGIKDQSLTVKVHLDNHIDQLTGVTDGTKAGYRTMVAKSMNELLDVPLVHLSRGHVAGWVNRLSKEGYSAKTIANVHGFLSSAINSAIIDKLIIENPCRGMRLPRTDHTDVEMTFLSQEEFAQLFRHIDPHFQPFVLTLVGTGMRFGEATALMVGDVDLRSKSIRVRQAWKKSAAGKRDLGAPKTKRSNRTVAIPPEVIAAITPLVRARGSKEFLFTSKSGTPILNATFWRNVWGPAVQDFAGDEVCIEHDKGGRKVRVVTSRGPGKHPRVHDLRHTHVSWAISAGISLPVIQRQLGHESVTTTVDRYGHLARSDFDALALSIGSYLPKAKAIESDGQSISAKNGQ